MIRNLPVGAQQPEGGARRGTGACSEGEQGAGIIIIIIIIICIIIMIVIIIIAIVQYYY